MLKFSPLSGPVSEILANVTFVTEKRDGIWDSRFAPSAKREAQTEAFGLRIAWPVVQSVCVPKISPLGGPGSEILANVTFVTDGRTDGRTHTLTARIIYIDKHFTHIQTKFLTLSVLSSTTRLYKEASATF